MSIVYLLSVYRHSYLNSLSVVQNFTTAQKAASFFTHAESFFPSDTHTYPVSPLSTSNKVQYYSTNLCFTQQRVCCKFLPK